MQNKTAKTRSSQSGGRLTGSIASIGFLEQINSPSGYHRDGEILHVIKLVGLQARSGVLVQSELGAAALRN